MLAFETALAAAEAGRGRHPARRRRGDRRRRSPASGPTSAPSRAATARDGVVVPELVRQLRAAVGEPHAARLHFGATSQDVIDTALVLRLKAALPVLAARLDGNGRGARRARRALRRPRSLMGRTRMQAAIPITAGARIASWRGPLDAPAGAARAPHARGARRAARRRRRDA